MSTFTPDASVAYHGKRYQGRDETRGLLNRAASGHEFTTTRAGVELVDEETVIVHNHREGNPRRAG